MNKIYILNGPNLNLLGTREPEIYGFETLSDIEAMCEDEARNLGIVIEFRQSNSEGELIDWIHEAKTKANGIIINAGAYTHTSIAIMDALLAVKLPVIEVHFSNLFKRENFRHHSYISSVANGLICGLGGIGYSLALRAIEQIA